MILLNKKQCSSCKYWIELIDNGQCKKDVKLYCEYDDVCSQYKKRKDNANDKLKKWLKRL